MKAVATTLEAEMTPAELALLDRTVGGIAFEYAALEIGTAAGGSLVRIAQAAPAARIVCIDPMSYFPNQLETVKANLARHEIPEARVELRIGKAERLLPAARRAAERFDFILIDGNHKYRHVVMDLAWSDLLVPEGRIALHDYSEGHPGVVKAVDAFLRINGYYRVVDRADSLIVIGRDLGERHRFRARETPLHHVALANLLTPISQNLKRVGLDFLKLV